MPTPDQPLTAQKATEEVTLTAINFPHCRIALLASTMDRALSLITSAGGVLALPSAALQGDADGYPVVRYHNGSTVTLYSLGDPDRLRGPQFHLGWVHEPPADPEDEAMSNLRLGVRLPAKEAWVGFDAGRIITSLDTVTADPSLLTRVARPFLGEPVHYQAHGSADGTYPPACRAATVTEVGQWVTVNTVPGPDPELRTLAQSWRADAVALHVTNPTGVFVNGAIEYDNGGGPAGRRGGTWHYAGDCYR